MDTAGVYVVLVVSLLIGTVTCKYETVSENAGPYETVSENAGPYETVSEYSGPYETVSEYTGPCVSSTPGGRGPYTLNCNTAKRMADIRGLSAGQGGMYDVVFLAGTPLEKLPQNSFGQARGYMYYVNENNITTVEYGALGFTNIHYIAVLYFQQNKISKFPFKYLKGFRSLIRVVLNENRLTRIPSNAKFPASLEAIYLEDNEISIIGAFAFSNAAGLKYVSLAGNRLVTLGENNFFVTAPVILNLKNNLISNIACNAFGDHIGGKHPEIVDLTNNELTSIEESTFSSLLQAGYTQLRLEGNPLQCDCLARWLHLLGTKYGDSFRSHVANFTCYKEGKPLWGLTSTNFSVCGRK